MGADPHWCMAYRETVLMDAGDGRSLPVLRKARLRSSRRQEDRHRSFSAGTNPRSALLPGLSPPRLWMGPLRAGMMALPPDTPSAWQPRAP